MKLLLLALSALGLTSITFEQAVTAGKYPVKFGFGATKSVDPKSIPPGANDRNCTTSLDNLPVILVHGTTGNQAASFAVLGPILANMGRCAYVLNYGKNIGSAYGLSDVYKSAQQLGRFVDFVLQETGMPKVDIIGHSQGGLLPNIYIKKYGGETKVNHVIGINPSNGGANTVKAIVFLTVVPPPLTIAGLIACKACSQQLRGSKIYRDKSLKPLTSPNVKYTVISSIHDLINKPYQRQQLHGKNVQNLIIQDGCRKNKAGHSRAIYDKRVMAMITNALIGRNDPLPCEKTAFFDRL